MAPTECASATDTDIDSLVGSITGRIFVLEKPGTTTSARGTRDARDPLELAGHPGAQARSSPRTAGLAAGDEPAPASARPERCSRGRRRVRGGETQGPQVWRRRRSPASSDMGRDGRLVALSASEGEATRGALDLYRRPIRIGDRAHNRAAILRSAQAGDARRCAPSRGAALRVRQLQGDSHASRGGGGRSRRVSDRRTRPALPAAGRAFRVATARGCAVTARNVAVDASQPKGAAPPVVVALHALGATVSPRLCPRSRGSARWRRFCGRSMPERRGRSI